MGSAAANPSAASSRSGVGSVAPGARFGVAGTASLDPGSRTTPSVHSV